MFGITGSGRLQTNLQCVIVKKEVFDFIPYIQNCLEPPFDLFIFKKVCCFVFMVTIMDIYTVFK